MPEATPGTTAAASHSLSTGGLIVLLMMLVVVVVIVVQALRSSRRSMRALACCPACRSQAVRRMRHETMSALCSEVAVECGQCGLWRRLLVTESQRAAHTRRFDRDRRRIRRGAARLEAERGARSGQPRRVGGDVRQ